MGADVGDASEPVVMVTVLMTVAGGTVTSRVTVTVAPGADCVVVPLGLSSCGGSGESAKPGASPGTSTSTWKLLSICDLIALV